MIRSFHDTEHLAPRTASASPQSSLYWLAERLSATSSRSPSDINLDLNQRISASLHRDLAHVILCRVCMVRANSLTNELTDQAKVANSKIARTSRRTKRKVSTSINRAYKPTDQAKNGEIRGHAYELTDHAKSGKIRSHAYEMTDHANSGKIKIHACELLAGNRERSGEVEYSRLREPEKALFDVAERIEWHGCRPLAQSQFALDQSRFVVHFICR